MPIRAYGEDGLSDPCALLCRSVMSTRMGFLASRATVVHQHPPGLSQNAVQRILEKGVGGYKAPNRGSPRIDYRAVIKRTL